MEEILVKNYSSTEFVDKKFTHFWSIKNFESICKKVVKSPAFFCEPNSKTKWRLLLYPSEYDYLKPLHLEVNLELDDCEAGQEIEVSYSVRIHQSEHESGFSDCYCFQRRGDTHIKRELIQRDKLISNRELLLPGKQLNLYCEINIRQSQVDYSYKFIPVFNLKLDYAKLLENKKFSDIIIRVKGKEFKAHKTILAARSPYFNAMFSHDTKETQNNLVELDDDIEPEVMAELLKYIYTETTSLEKILIEGERSIVDEEENSDSESEEEDQKKESQQHLAIELLKAASKYQLDGLMSICELVLYKFISMKSVVELLILAELHNATQLRENAIKFVYVNLKTLSDDESWKNFAKNNPSLELKILREFLSNVKM